MIYALAERNPRIAERTYVADNATLIGSVILAEDASVWFGAVIRADNDQVAIGQGSNIQDGSVIHTDPDFPVEIGERVTVGHRVVLHGCRIGDGTLVGINSVVLNGASIGENCIIGANSMVTSNKKIPPGSLVIGSPAKVVRELNEAELNMLASAADSYIEKIPLYRDALQTLT